MSFILHGKNILITGATSGIGRACALLCAKHGANLVLIARRNNILQEVAKDILNSYKVAVHLIPMDIKKMNGIEQELERLPEFLKKIDILINNAGLALGKDPLNLATLEDCMDMIDINFKGLLYMTKAVLPIMIHYNQGHIVNIGSIAGHETYSGGAIYCATKHAVTALSNGLKKDLLGTKIRVSLVSPGMVKTDFSNVRFKGNKIQAEAVYEGMVPLSAEDIAEAVVFCVTRPIHVNISEIIILPNDQASTTEIYREL